MRPGWFGDQEWAKTQKSGTQTAECRGRKGSVLNEPEAYCSGSQWLNAKRAGKTWWQSIGGIETMTGLASSPPITGNLMNGPGERPPASQLPPSPSLPAIPLGASSTSWSPSRPTKTSAPTPAAPWRVRSSWPSASLPASSSPARRPSPRSPPPSRWRRKLPPRRPKAGDFFCSLPPQPRRSGIAITPSPRQSPLRYPAHYTYIPHEFATTLALPHEHMRAVTEGLSGQPLKSFPTCGTTNRLLLRKNEYLH